MTPQPHRKPSPVAVALSTPASLCRRDLATVTHYPAPALADLPTPRVEGAGPLATHPQNVRRAAQVCRDGGWVCYDDWAGCDYYAVAGAPCVLDFETWLDDRHKGEPGYEGALPAADAAAVFAGYVRAFKAESPNVPVSVYGLSGWYSDITYDAWAAGLSAKTRRALAAEAETARVLLGACDAVTVSAYPCEPESIERDLAAFVNIIRWVRATFDKPCWTYLLPRYNFAQDQTLAPDHAARLLDLTRANADLTVLWGPWADVAAVFGPCLKLAEGGK